MSTENLSQIPTFDFRKNALLLILALALHGRATATKHQSKYETYRKPRPQVPRRCTNCHAQQKPTSKPTSKPRCPTIPLLVPSLTIALVTVHGDLSSVLSASSNELGQARRTTGSGINGRRNPAPPA